MRLVCKINRGYLLLLFQFCKDAARKPYCKDTSEATFMFKKSYMSYPEGLFKVGVFGRRKSKYIFLCYVCV